MIQVINRALDILEYMTKETDSPKTLSEIAENLQLNAGTCANILKTLVDRKYVDKLDKKKGYRLGIMSYRLTNNYNYYTDLVAAAKHEVELLTSRINENSICAILKDGNRIDIVRTHSNQALQANTAPEMHAFNSASGRLLVAMLPDDELENFIQLYGKSGKEFWEASENRNTLLKAIKKIRRDGYTFRIKDKQIVGIAVPLHSLNRVIASLAVYLPVTRFDKDRKQELLNAMRQTAKTIEKNLSK